MGVDDTRPTSRDASPLFSPQPFPPGLIGQRSLESTLFDLRALEDARRRGGPDALVSRPREPSAGSGLIDIKTLIGATQRGTAAASVPAMVLPARSLVAAPTMAATLPVVPPAPRTRTWLGLACVALFTTVVALAVAAIT